MATELLAHSSVGVSGLGATSSCLYCSAELETVRADDLEEGTVSIGFSRYWAEKRCASCGWWALDYTARNADDVFDVVHNDAHAFGVLERFDISSIEVPVGEIRAYLQSHYEARFEMSPRKLEELVAAILREHGYNVELTSYSKDGGVDIYLLTSTGDRLGAVQVKRHRESKKVGITEIDTFLGALLRHNISHGMFVTTSSFTRPALRVPSSESLKERAILIELWDSKRLLDALRSSRPISIPSCDAAWALKELMPMQHEPWGDYMPPWPVEPQSAAQLEWWVSLVQDAACDGLRTSNMEALIPPEAPPQQVQEWLTAFEGKGTCEIWRRVDHPVVTGERMECDFGAIRKSGAEWYLHPVFGYTERLNRRGIIDIRPHVRQLA